MADETESTAAESTVADATGDSTAEAAEAVEEAKPKSVEDRLTELEVFVEDLLEGLKKHGIHLPTSD